MSAKKGTYLIEFQSGHKYVVGNNYKPWWEHALSLAVNLYFYRDNQVPRDQIVKSVKYSTIRFVDDGGLKHCDAPHYQEVINDVAAKSGKQLLPFADYVFDDAPSDLAKLNKELARW